MYRVYVYYTYYVYNASNCTVSYECTGYAIAWLIKELYAVFTGSVNLSQLCPIIPENETQEPSVFIAFEVSSSAVDVLIVSLTNNTKIFECVFV